MHLIYFFTSFILIEYVYCQGSYAGDFCTLTSTGASGQCQLLENCPKAVHGLQNQGITPQTCGFQGQHPIVCCVENVQPPPVTTKTTKRPTTRAPTFTSTRVGQKSEKKCMEYEKYAYPQARISLVDGQVDVVEDDCTFHSTQLVVGGVVAHPQEFPHMALVGFDDGSGRKLWLCSGSLISERFVLTAAHCLYDQVYQEPKYIKLGELILNTEEDVARPEDLLIDQAFRHPGYTPPSRYNDIALLKMDRNAKLSTYVRPACLNTNSTLTIKKVVATEWGKVGYTPDTSLQIIKVRLEYVTNAECNNSYSNNIGRRLQYGIVDDSQICAGSHEETKDTCQIVSGGPLQVIVFEDCMYKILGVSSFRKACGVANIPDVYTRVSKYIEWIEGIVWP